MTDPTPLADPSSDSPPSCTRVIHHGGGGDHAPKEPPRTQPYVLEGLAVGADLFGFRLLHELGRGGFARVFLAQQVELASRLVALKFTNLDGAEPQTLAQLQHTHIVPIYSMHEDRAKGLRAVCMPYFGGATLGQVVDRAWSGALAPSAGAAWVDALTAVEAPVRPPEVQTSLAIDAPIPLIWLREHTFLAGAVWIAARLAEALHHAHDRGVIHRDVKPSNILLASDGQPLLLDFNVSQNDCLEPQDATLGGTVTYAAPEHIRALYSQRPDHFLEVDQRSDLYSLGLVLFKMITGLNPCEQPRSVTQRTPSARLYRSDIPWSLESILRRCLEPEPARRYQQAAHLAEDLHHYLRDEPLAFAPELSRVERVRKWGRRHPRLIVAGVVAAAAGLLLGATAGGIVAVQRHLSEAKDQLAIRTSRDRRAAYEAGALRALCLVNTVSDLPDQRDAGLAVCEDTLALYEVLGRDDWQQRPAWQMLTAPDRRRLAENTRELLVLLAWARVRAQPHNEEVVHDALALLERADRIAELPASRALHLQRAEFLEMLGQAGMAQQARALAETLPACGAQDHYLLATAYARRGTAESLRRAVAELDLALQQQPRHYWALAQRGVCKQELGEPLLAAADFSMCIGLWSDFAWGYLNRGYVLARSGHPEQALRDFSAALVHDPGFVEAYLNRALLQVESKQFPLALADFDQARQLGRDDAFVHAGRGVALEGLGRFKDADEAFEAALTRARHLAAPARLRIQWAYAAAIQARLPERARSIYTEILAADPHQPQALYGLAAVSVEEAKLNEGLAFFDRAVAADATFVAARRGRAVVQARLGRLEAASQDMNWCLEREPNAGITLYAAACVAALAAAQTPDPSLIEQALNLLEKAFAQKYGLDQAATDPDLRALRDQPAFKRLLERAK